MVTELFAGIISENRFRKPARLGFLISPLERVDDLKLSLINSVISSEARNLKSEIAACTTSLDSSLRCAAFRMTGYEGASF